VARDALVAADERLDTPHALQLSQRLRELGIGVVRFAEGLSEDELKSFLHALSRQVARGGVTDGEEEDDLAARLAAAGVRHVEVEAVDFSRLVATDALDVEALVEEGGAGGGTLWERILEGQMEGGVASSEVAAPSLASVLELVNRYLPRDLWGEGEAGVAGGGGVGAAETGEAAESAESNVAAGSGGNDGGHGRVGEGPAESRGAGAGAGALPAVVGGAAGGDGGAAGVGPDAAGAAAAPEIQALVRRLQAAVGEHAGEAVEQGRLAWIRQVGELVGALPRGLREQVLDAALERLAFDGGDAASAGDALEELATTATATDLLASLRRLRRHRRRFAPHAVAWLDGVLRSGTLAGEASAVASPEELRDLLAEAEDRPALRADEPVLSLPPSDPVLTPPSPALLDEMRGLDRGARAQQLLRTLLDLLEQAEDGEQAAAVAGRLEHLFVTLLQGMRLRAAAALVAHLDGVAAERAGDPVGGALAASLQRFAGDDTVLVLLDVLPALGEADLDDVRQLVGRLGDAMVRRLLVALGEEEERSRRRLLFDLLSTMSKEVAGEARRLLADERWYVVRNMVALLRAAGDRDAADDLLVCLSHADARVRLEALHTLSDLGVGLPRPQLDALLADPDPKVAARAVQVAGQHGGAATVDRLLDVVTPLDPLGRHRDLRVRSLLALGAIGDAGVLPRIKRYFSPLAVDALEERRAAFRSLQGYPASARAPWVAKGLKSRDGEIRDVCRRLSRLEDRDG
jgi:hypothetical protein